MAPRSPPGGSGKPKDPVTAYARDVVAGRIIAGPHVRNACRRHLDDLKRGPARGLKWNLEAALHGINFFPDVLRLNSGQFEGIPFHLHASQAFIVGSIEGWRRKADGTRRFRRGYIEEGKGNGKALALDTPVPTPKGWTVMGDLRTGDQVLDDRGCVCRVLKAHDVQIDTECFRVSFDDGASFVADAQHLWLTEQRAFSRGGEKRATHGIPRDRWKERAWRVGLRSSAQIASTLRNSNGKYQSANHSVALCAALDLAPAQLPIEPYTLGAWLGDGDSDCARITVGDADVQILEHLRAAGTFVSARQGAAARAGRYRIGSRPRAGREPVLGTASLNEKLRAANLLGNKHIPKAYLRASVLQRLSLLQGLMDTDGYVDIKGRCEFVVTCLPLAHGFHELALTLGLKVNWRQDRAKLNGRDIGPRYRIAFSPPDSLRVFRLNRKDARQRVGHSRRRLSGDRRIVGCERTASVPVRCISVDSPSQMYLIGREFVPTHNSPMMAGIGLKMMVADKEPRAEVYAAGRNKDQAMVLFRSAVAMVDQSPALERRVVKSGGNPVWNLADPATGSWFRPISAEDGKSGPTPHCALCDEVHEHRDSALIEMLERGFKWRRQPLLIMATNSGTDRQTVCWDEHEFAIKVAAGTLTPGDDFLYVGDVIDDEAFSYVCALDKDDDPLEDESCWIKANPLLGVTMQPEKLRSAVRQARSIPGKQNGILRLNFCVWTDSASAWMGGALIDKVLVEFDPQIHVGKEIRAAGADLSGNQDLTALAFMVETGAVEVQRENGAVTLPTYDAWVEAWTPADTLTERSLRDKMPYNVWVEQGHLHSSPGKNIRLDFVAARLAEINAEFPIRLLAYDRYAYSKLEQEMDAQGLTIKQIEHPQGGTKRSKPSEEETTEAKRQGNEPPLGLWMPGSVLAIETLILEERIRIRLSPLMRAAMMSATVEHDPFDNRWFSKRKAVNRIDPLVALTMAAGAAERSPALGKSVYEKRGLLVL